MPDDSANLKNLAPAVEEPDAQREARQRQAIAEALDLGREANRREPPPKYSLQELMLAVTLLATMLGLIRALGMWGAVLTFVGSVVWTNVFYPRWHDGNRPRQVTMFDCVWGLLMPLVCLVCDPFVFKEQPELIDNAFQFGGMTVLRPHFRQEGLAVYCIAAWQMLLLTIWIVGRPWLRPCAGFFLGTWLVGAMFAGVLGILLAPIAAIGSFVGIGLLGFTPLLTAYVVGRRMREAVDDGVLDSSDHSLPIFWLLVALGFMAAWIAPLQLATHLRPLFPV